MHLGTYLKELIKEKRFSVAEVAEKVAKSETSVRKDFEKTALHMGSIEAYAKVLGINIYQILSESWRSEHDPSSPRTYNTQELISKTFAHEPGQEIIPALPSSKKSSVQADNITVSIDLTGPKKDAILKILLQK
jgi:transcriptional regulator with XRE-family HTH domain